MNNGPENIEGCKNLISSIIQQAVVDACSASICRESKYNRRTAMSFIDSKNIRFNYLSSLIDYDPEFLASRLKKYIHKEYSKNLKIALKNEREKLLILFQLMREIKINKKYKELMFMRYLLTPEVYERFPFTA